jgi:hypothetical protein
MTFAGPASLRLAMALAAMLFPVSSMCQSAATVDGDQTGQTAPAQPTASNPAPPDDKRVLWIIPNFRTVPTLANYKPITSKEKFNIAVADSFDRGTVALAALFAGQGQLTKSNPSFGDGIANYGRYFATAYADLVIGDFMTEAIYPSILHQDPRYFRRGTGRGWSRLGYAVGKLSGLIETLAAPNSTIRRSSAMQRPLRFRTPIIRTAATWAARSPSSVPRSASTWLLTF